MPPKPPSGPPWASLERFREHFGAPLDRIVSGSPFQLHLRLSRDAKMCDFHWRGHQKCHFTKSTLELILGHFWEAFWSLLEAFGSQSGTHSLQRDASGAQVEGQNQGLEKWSKNGGQRRLGGRGREGAGWGKGSCQTPTLEGSGNYFTRPASASG